MDTMTVKKKKAMPKWLNVALSVVAVMLGLASLLIALFLMFLYSSSPTFENSTNSDSSSNISYSNTENVEAPPVDSGFGPIEMTPVD